MPADPSISALLRSSPAFAQLSPERAEELIALTSERTLAPAEYLAYEGDPGDELCLVVSGSLTLSRRSSRSAESPEEAPLPLGLAGPGSIVGELGLLTGHAHAASIQADQPTVIRALSSSQFEQL